ncbi:MAG: hypothetical protein J6K99_07035, partial [Peptococcaceae bacterium]|nr:hypothetical protein [Peptococcaceae bacterium]
MSAIAASSTAMSAIAASSTAMSAIAASSTAMSAIAKSAVALNRIIKVASACTAIVAKISSYRSNVVSALANTTYFSKTSGTTVGNGNTTATAGLNTNTFYIPTGVYDDGDTTFKVYSGVDQSTQILSSASHSGTTTVSSGVALRGVKVVGSGSTVGNVIFDVYTAK